MVLSKVRVPSESEQNCKSMFPLLLYFIQKCDLCPLKNGAFKRSNSNRCGWAHVLCALCIPEAKFSDNKSMDLIQIDTVPQERYNKVF